jgi:hypothetical protein
MYDYIEKLILADAKKLAKMNKKLPRYMTKDLIKKQLSISTKPQRISEVFLAGPKLSTLTAQLLQASYMDEYTSLFTNKQRKIMAQNIFKGIVSIAVSFILIALFVLYLIILR